MKKESRLPYALTPVVISFITLIFESTLLSFTEGSSLNTNILFFTISAGFALTFLLSLTFSDKLGYIFSIIIFAILAISYSTEILLKRSLGYFYPPEIIFNMADDVIGSYSGTVFLTLKSGIIPLTIIFTVFALYAFLGRKLSFHPKHPFVTRTIIFLSIFLVHSFGYMSVQKQSRSIDYGISDYQYYTDFYDFNESVSRFGLITGIRLNIFGTHCNNEFKEDFEQDYSDNELFYTSFNTSDVNFSSLSKKVTDSFLSSLHSYFAKIQPSEKNEYTGIFKGKNLIFICAEALSPYVISEENTPTLYKLSHSGIIFKDYYQPSFGESTSGGEYSLLLSQVPKRNSGERGMSMTLASKDNLRYSLPALFRLNGYHSFGYHNNSYTYYSRNITHPKMLMDWFGCGGSVTENENDRFDISEFLSPGWPKSDSEMIKATVNRYANNSEPFFCYYITVSGHNNYSFTENTASRNNIGASATLPYSERVRAYISCQHELEKALSLLISELKNNGILDDTVIVISNDHYPYGLSPGWQGNLGTDPLSELYGHKVKSNIDREKGVFIVWSSNMKNSTVVSKPVSSFDVMPTLLNLFGIPYESRVLVGRDALSSGDGLVFFSDMSWITNKAQYDASLNKLTVFDDSVDDSYAKNITKTVKNKIYHSMLLRQKSYFSEVDLK